VPSTGAVKEGTVERELTARLQHAPDFLEHLQLVRHQVNGVEEDDGVGRLHELREPLGTALLELGPLRRDRCPRLDERGRRRIDTDDARRRLLVAHALDDQLRDRTRAAAEVDDDLAAGSDHPLHDPAVDVQEERVPRERCKRKPIVVCCRGHRGHSL